MITVKADIEFLRKSLFEFLRIKFPEYINSGQLQLDVINNYDTWKFEFAKDGKVLVDTFDCMDHKKVHYIIKKKLFDAFQNETNFDTSYGILSGVRPLKLARKTFLKNSFEDSIRILSDRYRIPEKDTKFLYKIYCNQKHFERTFSSKNYNIYINIPFCPSRCSYCSFDTAVYNKDMAEKYVNSLLKEINSFQNKFIGHPHSIYIGGGTPSSIETSELERVIKLVLKKFGNTKEFTVECGRIDTLSVELLKMLKYYGVNRISLNPQSFNENVIRNLNRNSNVELKKWFDIAKEIGFDIINMDLIMGLPGEDIDSILNSIKKAIKIGPENITIHTLALKNGSKLFESGYETHYDYNNLLNKTKSLMESFCYEPYYMYRQKKSVMNSENIGYARNNKNSIYNIVMMEELENILGFGAGASTKILNEYGKFHRNINTKNLTEYINARR